MPRLAAIALACLALAGSPAPASAEPAPKPAAKAKPRGDRLGLAVPPGSRLAADQLWTSRKSFRDTVRFYRRLLKRRAEPHRAVPTYRHNGVVVARFIATSPKSRWLAIHVFQADGRTRIALVPRPAKSALQTSPD